MIKFDSYTPDAYPFPPSNIDPRLKLTPEYCKRRSEAIYSLYLSNGTSWGYDSMEYFDTCRAYANGRQDVSQYKSFIKNGTEEENNASVTLFDDNLFTKEAKRKGYYGLMFQTVSPAPKILNTMHGIMEKLDYDILADTIDADSRGLIESMKYQKMFEAIDKPFLDEFKKKAGIPVEEDSDFPTTKKELDALEAKDGFKLNVAKYMQQLIRYSFAISKWDSVVKKKLRDDLACTGYATSMDYFDIETQTFKVKWLDPKKTIIQYSDEMDYSDSEYGGYFDTMTISSLRQCCPQVDEDPSKLISLAKSYKGRFGNPSKWQDKYSHLDPVTKGWGFDSWTVCVFKAYWIEVDHHRRLLWKGVGSERIRDINYDTKIKPLTENQKTRGFIQEITDVPIRQVYQCSWIVGSDIVYDYGKFNMGSRPEMTEPELPIHAEQLLQPSIIYRLIPVLDNIAIADLQFKNDLANLIQRGYAINMGMLMNVVFGDKELDPASSLTMLKQKGLLPFMASMTGSYEGGSVTPIIPIDGGLGKRVEETLMTMNMYYQTIENIVGPIASSPNPNAAVGIKEAEIATTNRILMPILDAMFEIKESMAESLCSRIQIGLRVSEKIRKAYSGVINPTGIKTMLLAEQNGTKYGIILRARPDDQQKSYLLKYMEACVTSGQLMPTEAMYFTERLESGIDLVDLRQEIDFYIEKNKKAAQQEKIELVNAQNQGLAAIEQQKGQINAQQSILDTQSKIAEEKSRGDNKVRVTRTQNNYKLMSDIIDGMKQEEGLQNNKTQQP
jgi:hypothetical protein